MGRKPAESNARTDATLPGATWAKIAPPSGTNVRAASARRRPRPRWRAAGSTSNAHSRRPARPRPITSTPCSSLSVNTLSSVRYRAARRTRSWPPRSSRGVSSRSAASAESAAITRSRLPGRVPNRCASQSWNEGWVHADSSPEGSELSTSSAGTSAATTRWAVKSTIASAGPPGDGRTSTKPSGGGCSPCAAESSITARGCTVTVSRLGLQQLVGSGVRVEPPGSDLLHEPVEPFAPAALFRSPAQPFAHDGSQLVPQPCITPALQPPVGLQVRAVVEDRAPQLVDAAAVGRDRLDDGRAPVARARQLEHDLQVTDGLGGAVAIGLVHDEHVGDLEEAGLVGLHAVTPARVHDHHGGVGRPRHLDLDLPDADRLDDDPRLAGGVEDAHRLRGRQRQSAEVTTGGHRPDEHALVGGVVLHADAVAEDGPAGERAAGVDGQDADLGAGGADEADELVRQRRLARAGCAGDADRVRPARAGVQPADGVGGGIAPRLDERDELGDGGAIALPGRLDERGCFARGCYSEITSVIPGTRSMMIRSTPAFRVIIDTGHVPHAPTRVTWTPPSASMPLKTMSPPSLCSAGRMASIASRTPASLSSVSVSVGMDYSVAVFGPGSPRPTPPFSHGFPRRQEPPRSAGPDPADVGAERPELAGEIDVPTVDVEGIEHAGLALGGEAGDDEGSARPHVLGTHRRPGQPVDTPDDGVATLVADVGAHPVELVDEPEAVVEHVLGDDGRPLGGRE